MKKFKTILTVLLLAFTTIAYCENDTEKLKLEIEKLKLENEGLKLKNENNKLKQKNEKSDSDLPEDLKECLYKNFKKCYEVAASNGTNGKRLQGYKYFELLINTLENACSQNNYEACDMYAYILSGYLKSEKSIAIYEKLCSRNGIGCAFLIKSYLKEGPIKAKVSNEEGLRKAKSIASKCDKDDKFYLCAIAGIYLQKYDKTLGRRYSAIALSYRIEKLDQEDLDLFDVLRIVKSCTVEIEVQNLVAHAHLGTNPYAKFYVNTKNKSDFKISFFKVLFSTEVRNKKYDFEAQFGKALPKESFKTEHLIALENKHVVNVGDTIKFLNVKPVEISFYDAKMETEFSDRLIDFCSFEIKYVSTL